MTTEYYIWSAMRQRCGNPKHPDFGRYGGRGITVCERWSKFENFYADMGDRPSKRHSLDREKNDLGYGPDNCVWSTHKQQTRNQRSNVRMPYNGSVMCLSEIAEAAGVPYNLLWRRVRKRGESLEYAIGELQCP